MWQSDTTKHSPCLQRLLRISTSLRAGTKLRYRIYAKHEDWRSLVSRDAKVEIGAANVPDCADRAAPWMESAGSIKLRWTHSAGVDTGYRIDVSDNDGEVWEELELNTGLALEFPGGTSHVYNDGGLEPGTIRRYRIFTNDGGIFSLPTPPVLGDSWRSRAAEQSSGVDGDGCQRWPDQSELEHS